MRDMTGKGNKYMISDWNLNCFYQLPRTFGNNWKNLTIDSMLDTTVPSM